MRIFVTGATGFLGSEVVPLLLDRGAEVVALSRKARQSHHPGLSYVVGDLEGTLPAVTADAVLHMAGVVHLGVDKDDRCSRVNYLGTKTLVEYAADHYIPRFYHVSTLYIDGGEKVFRESEFPIGGGWRFRNAYERSKYLAEDAVRSSGLEWAIFRPGILAGAHADGRACTFEGFYRPLQAIVGAHRFAEKRLHLPPREEVERKLHLPALRLPIRVHGDPESHLALTPIDWAAQTIVGLMYDEGSVGRVFHVVPEKVPTNREVATAICDALGIKGFHFGLKVRKGQPLDAFYNRMIRDFLPYLQAEPRFWTSVGHACPPVDHDYLVRVITYWRNHDYKVKEDPNGTLGRPGETGEDDALGGCAEGCYTKAALG